MDTADVGENQEWYLEPRSETILLPGSMAENDKGLDIDLSTRWTATINGWPDDFIFPHLVDSNNVRIPWALQPVKEYTGAAWYQKEVEIPAAWEGKSIEIYLERPHWRTTAYIDGQKLGGQNSLGAPHLYPLPPFIQSGKHLISIRVDNRLDEVNPGPNSHSVTDHTQTNWNGIVGDIALRSRDLVHISSLRIYPDVENRRIKVEGKIRNGTKQTEQVEIVFQAKGKTFDRSLPVKSHRIEAKPGDSSFESTYEMGENIRLWDEFSPDLYQLEVRLAGKASSEVAKIFGMREFRTRGRRFVINGRPVFLRGTLECAVFPKTGYPPTDTGEWKRIYKIIKSFGLNHMRFHSWCPPEAAFVAADEEGVYLQVECSSWAGYGVTIGDGKPIDRYLYKESKEIVDAYGDHPSFCMMTYGNEPAGENYREFLGEFVNYWKRRDSRRVYSSASGWPADNPENEYGICSSPRIHGKWKWHGVNAGDDKGSPKTNFDFREIIFDHDIPYVGHETGQWCAYPDFKEIEKYTGVLKAGNFELFRDLLDKNGLGHLSEDFLMASGKLQALCYKADIEAALRTPEFAGFQLLDLHDHPGFGTSLVGVLNAFWEEKGYITAEEYRRFCNTTVPLARLEKRVFTNNDTLKATIEVAHFGKEDLSNVVPEWSVKDKDGNDIANGKFPSRDFSIDNCQEIGEIIFPLNKIKVPAKIILEIKVDTFANSWDLWVFPNKMDETMDGDIQVVTRMDDTTVRFLEEGGKVLWSLGRNRVHDDFGGNIGLGFLSIFWNTAWINKQESHALGILCDPGHPALEKFPTEYHSNWQWWDPIAHADVTQLDSFPEKPTTLVRVIDDWFTARDLALIFEARVGKGKMIVSGIDLVNDLENRHESRQLRLSLLEYMENGNFDPRPALAAESIREICG